MFGPSSKKIKIEATNARVVEGQDDFEVESTTVSSNGKLAANPVPSLNQSHITYKLISPQSSTSSTSNSSSNAASNVHTVLAPVSGQFYVIGNPSEVAASGGRVLAPKTTLTLANSSSLAVSDPMNTSSRRIDRRRATHNEVERRRRDTINAWIMQLGKLIPDLDMDDQEKGPPKGGALSKGGILAKACDFVTELTEDNKTLLKRVKELENVAEENERLLTNIEELREENSLLKQRLENHGITAPSMEDILGS